MPSSLRKRVIVMFAAGLAGAVLLTATSASAEPPAPMPPYREILWRCHRIPLRLRQRARSPGRRRPHPWTHQPAKTHCPTSGRQFSLRRRSTR